MAEDGGRRCRGSVGDVGDREQGKPSAQAPASCREARTALRLWPQLLGAPTQPETLLGCSRRRRHHLEDPAKVWIWGRALL